MKLQTKVALSIIPLVLLSISILGMWSLKKAEQSLHKSTFLYMDTIVDVYLADIDRLNQLLVKNGLDTVGSFVSAYKQNAFTAGEDIKIHEKSHIFVFDASGQLVFCTDKVDKETMESIWGSVARAAATSGGPEYGYQVMASGSETLYVARPFEPWNWIVFFAMEDQVVQDAERQIRNATITIAGLCSILAIALILIIFRKFFVGPIDIIGDAASAIAGGEDVKRIAVTTKDELGDLARNMEAMSDSIQKKQAEIQKSRDELESRVKERTLELETALSEIKILSGLLPICAHCKKIRDDRGYWKHIESYIQEHSNAELSHSICQECAKKFYPDYDLT